MDAEEAAAEKLQAKIPELEDIARKLGLYLDQAAIVVADGPQGPMPVLMANMAVNKVAFSERIQKPVEDEFATKLKEIEIGMADEEAIRIREQMTRNIAAGRDPLDDGDDDGDE